MIPRLMTVRESDLLNMRDKVRRSIAILSGVHDRFRAAADLPDHFLDVDCDICEALRLLGWDEPDGGLRPALAAEAACEF